MKKIVCISTYPPRECGIATFSHDLIRAILYKFEKSYSIEVCAVESTLEKHSYPEIVKYSLNTSEVEEYIRIADLLNNKDADIDMVLIQHEFGLFIEQEEAFLEFVKSIAKPVVIVFHTVLPKPVRALKHYVQKLTEACSAIVVMTQTSSHILQKEYHVQKEKINIIPHGTHLVIYKDKRSLKEKYDVSGRTVLSTFGLLSPGKSIETTLDALPEIVKENPSVLFLIIGKTHPTIIKTEGEAYREMLEAKVIKLGLTDSVRFVNCYLALPVLLEYLQLTDVYLFTSDDPNQAVSGTFVYALSCGCPIIATPIPHALELLKDKSGIIFNFKDSKQLAKATNRLLSNESLRSRMRITGLQKTMATAWENSAIAHVLLFGKIINEQDELNYSLPPINTEHIKRMSHGFAMIQFSKGNRPDIKTGYTLDDNARALMALCQVYTEKGDTSCEKYIKRYLNFIKYCLLPDGSFLNYVDKELAFTDQNQEVGLEDSNARAICALGYFISQEDKFPNSWVVEAIETIKHTFSMIPHIQSPRSMAFIIKGLSYYHRKYPSPEVSDLIVSLANKLASFYKQSADKEWFWFEAYLTYDNSILSESLLYAYQTTGNESYKEIAKESFDFLLKKTVTDNSIKVISNQGWLQREKKERRFGEQPVDVAGTVIALTAFYDVFKEKEYITKQKNAFNWFLGNNHLHQIIYNPATGGCYDGLEENNINLNQGAESSVCYLMARLSMPEV
ncbi:glycosyltransferase [uncultured Bacteroides sp.]|uniref:glycosyltransferase n=1 Tax=uncultured Bacteroides sp. TaxID=162156 RepID=UPI002AA7C48D|nr:glycosyltransferase [uncultured Bacteroides sp.]